MGSQKQDVLEESMNQNCSFYTGMGGGGRIQQKTLHERGMVIFLEQHALLFKIHFSYYYVDRRYI